MLLNIHDKLKGWFAAVVLGSIGLVFIFWGINWTLSAPNYVAKVNGSEISPTEVRQAYQQQLAQVERQTQVPLTDELRSSIKQRVLDEYVNEEALVTWADGLGYRVGDNDVLAQMAQEPAFLVDGKFDYGHALALLRAQGRSPAEIEEFFRRQVKRRQLGNALSASSFTTEREFRELVMITRQQRELQWLTFSAAKYADTATPDAAQIDSFYQAHKGEYMTPETVNLQYVELSLAAISEKIKVDDVQLKAEYEQQLAKTPEHFTQPEQRHLRHILLSVSDPKEEAAVKAKAEDLFKRAKGGEDFGKLAKEFSQDPGSAAQGGDLGWSDRKLFVAPFADAAFAMKTDDIAGPVKTQFGYHILKLEGVKPASVKSFDEARNDIETEFRRNEAERLYNDAAEKLADASLQNVSDLNAVAGKVGLPVKDIADFRRNEGGGALGKSQPVIDAAFSQDVLDGRLSNLIEVDKGQGVVLRATDHKLPQQKPLEAVRGEVLSAWKKQRGVELAAAAAADAVKSLRGGTAFDAVAKSAGQTPAAPKYIGRSEQDVPFEVRSASFSAPKPQDKPTFDSVALANGDSALFAISAVRVNPSDEGFSDIEIRRQYAARIAAGEAQSYGAGARAMASVTLNPKAVD
jgi:peptidyl-prolyl cis-trans isomerase D